MKPRPYQAEALRALTRGLDAHDSVVLALPTGSGKTYVAATWLIEHYVKRGKQVVWIAHRRELLDQAYGAFGRLLADLDPAPRISWYASGRGYDPTGDIVLASVSSARDFPAQSTEIVVIDEAHHEPATTYQRVLERVGAKTKLGLTATPTRLDEKPLGFDAIAFQRTLMDLVREGWLARPLPVIPQTRLSFEVTTRAGDLARDSLTGLDTDTRNGFIAEHWQQHRQRYGKTLVFALNRDHAQRLSVEFKNLRPSPRVGVVLGDLAPKERDARVDAFRSSELDILVNVEVFTEGFDCPDVRTVMLTRPTLSPTLYLQMVGRGTRIAPGKRDFYLVDFEDQLGDFQSEMIRPWVLGGELRRERAQAQRQEADSDLPAPLAALQRYDPVALDELAGYVLYSSGQGEESGYFVHNADEAEFLAIWEAVRQDAGALDADLLMRLAGPPILQRVPPSKLTASLFELRTSNARYVRLRAPSLPSALREFLEPAGLTEQDELELGRQLAELWAVARYHDDELSHELSWIPLFRLERPQWSVVFDALDASRATRGSKRRELLRSLYAEQLEDSVVTEHQWERIATLYVKDPDAALSILDTHEVATETSPSSAGNSPKDPGHSVEATSDRTVRDLSHWRHRLTSKQDYARLSPVEREQIREQFGSATILLAKLGLLPTLDEILAP